MFITWVMEVEHRNVTFRTDDLRRGRCNWARTFGFYCGCTRAKSRKALNALSCNDLQEMIAEGEPAHITCGFCGRHYTFAVEEMAKVLAKG